MTSFLNRLGSIYRQSRSPRWVKVENPNKPAVKREAETLPRKPTITLRAEIAGLLASKNLGNTARILEDKDVVLLLRSTIKREGSISAFAQRHGMERTNLTNVLNGKRPVSSSIVEALGLRKVYVPKTDNV
jgi:DNA-binding phage protein